MGFEDLAVFHHPLLQRVINGVRRLRGEADTKERRPITRDLLLRVLSQFDTTTRQGATLHQGARWSAPKLRTTGPDRSNGPLVQTGLMIFLMVLDRSDCADGLVWTIGPNGPPMEFSMWNI